MQRIKQDPGNFVYSNFEVESYATNAIKSNNPSVLSRFRNLVMRAFGIFNKLPRLIVVVCEDDLAKAIHINDFGISEGYQRMCEWLIREYKRNLLTIKEKLPRKSICTDWPHILFLAPSVHKNYNNDKYRKKFTHAMENALRESRNAENMSILRLRQMWDSEDGNIFLG